MVAYLTTIKGSFIYYVRIIFRKTNITYSLIRIGTYTYQGVRNINSSDDFEHVLNE